MQQIRYIKHNNIDFKKWDACIDAAPNNNIYAYSWYLNAMAGHWDALVLNDYEAVFPLTLKKKWGIAYLYQPWFCAALGVFSKKEITAVLLQQFLEQIPYHIRYIDIYLNKGNVFELSATPLKMRTNYVLSLQPSYEQLYRCYRNNLKRNIKKAETAGLTVRFNISVQQVLQLATPTLQRISDITTTEINRFMKVYNHAEKLQQATTLGIYSANGKQLLASAVFLFNKNRWYYILVGNHPNGKTIGASHYLIDRFIHSKAGTESLLDFEGSDIGNLAFFYSSYGAIEEKYAALRMNRLPRLLRWLKK